MARWGDSATSSIRLVRVRRSVASRANLQIQLANGSAIIPTEVLEDIHFIACFNSFGPCPFVPPLLCLNVAMSMPGAWATTVNGISPVRPGIGPPRSTSCMGCTCQCWPSVWPLR
jgi:hypothetical protein